MVGERETNGEASINQRTIRASSVPEAFAYMGATVYLKAAGFDVEHVMSSAVGKTGMDSDVVVKGKDADLVKVVVENAYTLVGALGMKKRDIGVDIEPFIISNVNLLYQAKANIVPLPNGN